MMRTRIPYSARIGLPVRQYVGEAAQKPILPLRKNTDGKNGKNRTERYGIPNFRRFRKSLATSSQKSLPRYRVAWTRAFLQHRTVVLRVNESEFSYPIRVGVPQGSPLSPTLFLVYVDDLLQQLSQVVHFQAFANDMFIWDIATIRGSCPLGVQTALHLVESWSDEWGMAFNVSKCQAIDIMTLRATAPLAVLLHGETVPQVTVLKYLGVWVDSQLRWDHHIRESCRLRLDRLRSIRRMCATYWGLHPRVVSVLVRAIILPKLFYGVSAWGGMVRFLARLLPIDRVLR